MVGGAFSKVYSNYSTSAPLVLVPALDPFARTGAVNPASLANVFGTELINASSMLDSVDGKVTTDALHPARRPGRHRGGRGLAARVAVGPRRPQW